MKLLTVVKIGFVLVQTSLEVAGVYLVARYVILPTYLPPHFSRAHIQGRTYVHAYVSRVLNNFIDTMRIYRTYFYGLTDISYLKSLLELRDSIENGIFSHCRS